MRFLSLILLAACSLLAAESPDKVLALHVSAWGGAKALKARDAVEYRGEARTATGERGSFTLAIHAPNLIYLELATANGGWSEADNGKSAWQRDGQGLRTLSGSDSRQLRALAYFLNAGFIDYRKDKWAAVSRPAATVDGRQTDAIEMTNDASELAGARCQFYFDSATHALLKAEQTGGDSITFGDYRVVSGVSEPFHMVLSRGAQTLDIVFSEVIRQADLHMFDYPGGNIGSTPDMAQLFEDLRQHQGDMRNVRRQYSCTVDEVGEEVDGKGKVKKSSDERYYMFYLGNREVRKHIASNGRPLSDAELKKEDERIAREQKQWEEAVKKRMAERAGKGTKAPPQQQNQDEEDMIRDVLKVMQFTNFRREPFRGREVLVFDFSPKPDYKPHGMQENLVSKFIGTMWVDEADHQVARVQARSAGSFKVGGGLVASVDSGASFAVEQEKMNGEIWVPVMLEVHFAAHALLVVSEKANVTEHYRDYKKFSANSTVTFGEIPH